MLKSILKIMEKSKTEGVDIIVAKDMLINQGENPDEMEEALKVYNTAYKELCQLKKEENYEAMGEIVKLAQEKEYDKMKEYYKELKK